MKALLPFMYLYMLHIFIKAVLGKNMLNLTVMVFTMLSLAEVPFMFHLAGVCTFLINIQAWLQLISLHLSRVELIGFIQVCHCVCISRHTDLHMSYWDGNVGPLSLLWGYWWYCMSHWYTHSFVALCSATVILYILVDSYNILTLAGLILPGLGPANERWRYFVTTSLIGGAQA